jgi:CheY-like chemotaxis protein
MKILVVDDERDVEQLFRLRFRKEISRGEIDLVFAFSGEEALATLDGNGRADVVLVLSDINMPGMTGLELLRRIKEEPPPVPVCMMTAYDNEAFRSQADALECDGYVSKPIDFMELKDRIRSLVQAG